MPITYGGLTVTTSTAALALQPPAAGDAAAQRWWHRLDKDLWEYQGYLQPEIQHLPVPYPPRRAAPRLGVLHWPTGADRWATLHLAIPRDQIIALRALAGPSPVPRTLTLTDGAGGAVAAQMYCVCQEPISARADDLEYGLATFVDQRYFWWQAGAAATPTAAATWESLLLQLFAPLGVVPTIDPVAAAYLAPNMARWSLGAQPLPPVIEAACRTVGLRVVVAPDGAVSLQGYAAAAAAEAARWAAAGTETLAGGLLIAPDVARGLPAAVAVAFFDGTATAVTLAATGLAVGGVTGVAGKSALVVADPAAPTAPQKAAYAAAAALDYYRWALTLTDATLRGFPAAVRPCGLDDCVEWVHAPDGLLTRVLRPPWADRNVYGGLPPSGSGGCCAPSGSGAAGYCEEAVEPITFNTDFGAATLTISSLDVATEGGRLVITPCATATYNLGPHSPTYPGGTPMSVLTQSCPVYTTLNYKDHDGNNQSIQVQTGNVNRRVLINAAVADLAACNEPAADDCCSGSGSGNGCPPDKCTLANPYCPTGTSAVLTLMLDALTSLATLYYVCDPADGNVTRYASLDLRWDLRYVGSYGGFESVFLLTDTYTGEVYVSQGGTGGEGWSCTGTNQFASLDAGGDTPYTTPAFDCAEVGYDCADGICIAVPLAAATYATPAECAAACPGGGGTIPTACCETLMPETLYITWGGALAALGTTAVVYDAGLAAWVAAVPGICGGDVELACVTVGMTTGWRVAAFTTFGSGIALQAQCPGDGLVFAGENSGEVCPGAATATVTTAP